MKKFLLAFVAMVGTGFISNAAPVTTTLDFGSNEAFSTWKTSYEPHTLDFPEAVVVFSNANKQQKGNAIDDCPVTKGIADVTVTMKEGYTPIQSITLNVKSWKKKNQTISAYASTDGENYTAIEGATISWDKDPNVQQYSLEITELPEECVSVKFSTEVEDNQAGWESMVITYGSGEGIYVSPVRFSVSPGEVIAGTEVELTCATEGTKIYYTTNGENPTNESTEYTIPLVITEDVTIKAIAYLDDIASNVTTAQYTIIELTPLADVLDLEKDETFAMGSNLIVVFVNGNNFFVVDEEDVEVGSMIYKSGLDLNPGDVILKGWQGKVDFYNGLFELVPTSSLELSGETAEIPAPREITSVNEISEALVNNIVVLKNVKIDEATPEEKDSFTGTIDGEEVTLYNNYELESVEANNYDIKAVTSIYKGAVQFYPISYVKAGSSAVEAIEAEGAVGYFNLQGMRIDNPSNGIIIVRSGKTAKKVLVK